VVGLIVAINQAVFAFAPATIGAFRDATSDYVLPFGLLLASSCWPRWSFWSGVARQARLRDRVRVGRVRVSRNTPPVPMQDAIGKKDVPSSSNAVHRTAKIEILPTTRLDDAIPP
jgi:hypothetical protein